MGSGGQERGPVVGVRPISMGDMYLRPSELRFQAKKKAFYSSGESTATAIS